MKRIIGVLFFFCCAPLTRNGLAQSGTITTYAGNGSAGFGGDDGLATSAVLRYPAAVAVDAAGNLFIADTENHRIREVTPDGVIRTIAGNGTAGFGGDGGPATAAQLDHPFGIAVDSSGNVFIADYSNSRVRKVTPDGVINTVAGNGSYGYSGDGGPATSAGILGPIGVAIDSAGNLFITDYDDSRVRKVTPDGTIRTVAGTGAYGFNGNSGLANSTKLAAPWGIVLDSFGNFYVADSDNGLVRRVTPDGQLSTVAGNVSVASKGDGGPATNSALGPAGIAVDAAGNLYITDWDFSSIRKVTPSGLISTVAGNVKAGFSGDGINARSDTLNYPIGVAVDAAGNLFIADTENNRVRKVEHRSRHDFNGGHDFNGDSKADVLFRDAAGNVSLWLLNGYAVTANSFVANIWTGWTIAGTGDFNGDGKTDILWRDTAGNVATWLMDGATISSYSGSGSLPASWTVAAVEDFNGDGMSDIIWRDTGGDVAIWLMNGYTVASSKTIANIWTGWKLAGAGDFNGDGKSDILWLDSAGNAAIWLMDGMTVSSYGSVDKLSTQWSVAGVADFDGDGAADILWRDTAGNVALWLMNGIGIASNWNFATISTGWTIVGTGDFNGDIRADIAWRDTAGNVAIWLMDGPNILSYGSMGNVSDRMVQ